MPRRQQRHPHGPTGRTTHFGKVADPAANVAPPANVPRQAPKDWKMIGKPLVRQDTQDKFTGAQVCGMGLKLPGVLSATSKDCPVLGGKVKSFEARAIASRPGSKKVVAVGDSALAVVADT